VFCDDFLLFGENTPRRKESSFSLSALSQRVLLLDALVKRRKRETKGKKETTKRGEKERLVLTGSRLLKKYIYNRILMDLSFFRGPLRKKKRRFAIIHFLISLLPYKNKREER
jgi:hypothetical protein